MTPEPTTVRGPLAGVRVLQLPAIGPVPLLSMLLSDLGAQIVRVDRPGSPAVAGPMARGVRAIAVDVRARAGAELVLRLAATCDVLVEGFRPGVAERLGIGPAQVHARNPALVYGRLTGWGQEGPLAGTAGHDINYLALSGLLAGIGGADGPPVPPVNYVADYGGGSMFLAVGVLAGLLHARASGQGQVVDAAMVDGASYLGSATRNLMARGRWTDRRGGNFLDGSAPNYRCYACADGRYVAVGALEPRFWSLLLATLGLDPATTPSPYVERQWDECAAVLAAAFRGRTRDEWAETFAPLDACVTPVLSLREAVDHPHLVARNGFGPVAGVPMPRPAPRFSATPGEFAAAGEGAAADATELLAAAGYGESDIAELRAAEVVAW